MMSLRNVKVALLFVMAGVVASGISGCAGNPENVLEGKWLVTTDVASTLPNPTYLTFNGTGEITQLEFVSNGAVYTYDSSSGLRGSATVDGLTITISETWGVNTISYVGTFNDNYTEAKGTLTTAAEVGNLDILFMSVPATMTKQ